MMLNRNMRTRVPNLQKPVVTTPTRERTEAGRNILTDFNRFGGPVGQYLTGQTPGAFDLAVQAVLGGVAPFVYRGVALTAGLILTFIAVSRLASAPAKQVASFTNPAVRIARKVRR